MVNASGFSIQAQNQSADNSDVIDYNFWLENPSYIDCPETGLIVFASIIHIVVKNTPSGKWSAHFNAYGEGFDDSGGAWKFHDTWNRSAKDGWHETRVLTAQGPKGAKLQMKMVLIIKDGEIVIDKFDGPCE